MAAPRTTRAYPRNELHSGRSLRGISRTVAERSKTPRAGATGRKSARLTISVVKSGSRKKRTYTFSASEKLPAIKGYDVRNVLGYGGMGIVYTAIHLKLNRVVALKMLLAGPYASSQEIARFVRESQAEAGLQHPNIVQVHDFGDLDGVWDTEHGIELRCLEGHTAEVYAVAWSPDGSQIASAGRDGAVKIWVTQSGNEALDLECGVSQLNSVAWSSDGMTMVTAAKDHKLRIYDATKGYVASRAASLLPVIERHLSIDASKPDGWLLRAEILACKRYWKRAAEDFKKYLLLKPESTWLMLDALFSGPYPVNLDLPGTQESIDFFSDASSEMNHETDEVKWKTIPYSNQGLVDFRPLLEYREQVSGYAMFPIYSIGDQTVALLLGADDQAVAWLNGERIFQSAIEGEAIPDAEAVTLALKAGWNSLLVRVANKTGEHALYL